MDNVFAQIKTTELKGSTFRSRILDFGDFDISGAEFKVVFKKAGNILPFPDFAPQKVGNALVIPYNILESYSGEIRMEAWMTLNGITDLAMVDTMLISAENSLKSDSTNQNITITFGDVVIPVTFTQAIVNIGVGTGSGENGKSAYEIAVLNGFPGTEAEWLMSLKGADGDPFTYEDFTPEQLALLKGEKGDPFEYADFTPEQLAALKGADGEDAVYIAGVLDNKVAKINVPVTNNGFYYNKDTGAYATLANFIASEKVAITADEYVLLNGTLSNVAGGSICFWDSSNVFIPYTEKTTYSNEYVKPPTNAAFFAYSRRTTDTLTATKVGRILVDSDTIPAITQTAQAGFAGARAANFYQLGENYMTSIKSRIEAANYGIVFIGQSNAVGQALYADLATVGLPDSLDVNRWNNTSMALSPMTIASNAKWGVWWGVLKRIKDYKPTVPLYYFNYSVGGSSLHTDWSVEKLGQHARTYASYMSQFKAYTPIVNIKALVWIQGENDHIAPYDAEYYQRLKNIVEFFKGSVGNPLIPFLIVGHHKNNSRYNQNVRDAQVKVANENHAVIFINPDSLTFTHTGDSIHYDGAYNEALAPLIFNVIKDL